MFEQIVSISTIRNMYGEQCGMLISGLKGLQSNKLNNTFQGDLLLTANE